MSRSIKTPSRRRAALIQGLGGQADTALTVIQGILLMPLYLEFVGSHLYGLWLASGGLLSILGTLDAGLGEMTSQRIASAYGENDYKKVGGYFANGVIFYIFVTIVFVALGLLASAYLPAILGIRPEHASLVSACFQIAVWTAGLNIINHCLRAFPQALLRPAVPTVSRIIARLVGIGVIVVMLSNGWGLWALAIGPLVAACGVFLSNVAYSVHLIVSTSAQMQVSGRILLDYLKVTPPLFVSKLGRSITKDIEPLFIVVALYPEMATAYSVTKRAGEVGYMIVSTARMSILPGLSHLVNIGSSDYVRRVVWHILIVVGGAAGVIYATYIALNHLFVAVWVGSDQFVGEKVVFLIGVSLFLYSCNNILSTLLHALGDFVISAYFAILESITKIALMWIFISTMGIVGVPIASLIAAALFLVVYSKWIRHRHGLLLSPPQEAIRTLFVVLIAFPLGGLGGSVIPTGGSWLSFLIYLSFVSSVLVGMAALLLPRGSFQAIRFGTINE